MEKLLLALALYKSRNAVERMFCRLKDYRRIATRYDKLATNFLGGSTSWQPSLGGYES
jgi:transposase